MPTPADPNRQRAKSRAKKRAARIVFSVLDQTSVEFDRAESVLRRAGFKDAHGTLQRLKWKYWEL